MQLLMFGFGQGIMPRSDKRGAAAFLFPHVFAVILQDETETAACIFKVAVALTDSLGLA